MKKLLAYFLFACFPLIAADSIITATITVTNTPSTNGWQIILNGSDARTVTNAFSATTIASNSSIGGIATNIYRHLVTNRFTSQRVVSMPATNQVQVVFNTGAAAVFTQTSNWLAFAYTTNSVSNSYTVRWPLSFEPSLTTRSNVINDLLTNLPTFGTNQLPGNTVALTNFISRSNIQTVPAAITFTGTNTFHAGASVWSNGYLLSATNVGGMISNAAINTFTGTNIETVARVGTLKVGGSLFATNGAFQNGLQSFSNDLTQVQIGTNAHAADSGSIAIGSGARAYLGSGFGMGMSAISSNDAAFAFGTGAYAPGLAGFAFGKNSVASNNYTLAMGQGAKAVHDYAFAFGYLVQTTETNQIRLGDSTYSASFPGKASFSNGIYIGSAARAPGLSGLSGGLQFTNGASASADPTNGAAVWAASGGIKYRASSTTDGAGGNNSLHNAGAETNGSGTDYSLTSSTAAIDFGGTDPQITLPSAGTYLLIASTIFTGANANDSLVFKLRDFTASSDIASASQTVTAHSTGNSQVNIQSIYTVSASSRIDFYGHNATAARGTVISTLTKIIYVRLY